MPETATPASASTPAEAEITTALGTRSVVLVGMMGAGKSTIGRRLSARLRLPFLDADNDIELAQGRRRYHHAPGEAPCRPPIAADRRSRRDRRAIDEGTRAGLSARRY